jgi:predicted RNA-binding protein YlxR (DUF448 family)/ribosomal protein L30E
MARVCLSCQASAEPAEMVRLMLDLDGRLVPDVGGGTLGRGAWVHPRPECLARINPRTLSRAFKREVRGAGAEVAEAIAAAGKRRALSLLGAAIRARKAVAGSTVVEETLHRGGVRLVVVATDARAAAELNGVLQAAAAGRALSFATKAELGAALGRPETGVMAILDDGLAVALKQAVALADLQLPRTPARKASDLVTEAR